MIKVEINSTFLEPSMAASNDETRAYAVNLQLKPVENGIVAVTNTGPNYQFRGSSAFHQYFHLVAPENNIGYTLPDVWDGYFHITLAKFFSRLAPDQLDNVFRDFTPPIAYIPTISNTVFRSTRMERVSGRNRARQRHDIDFIILPLDVTAAVRDLYQRLQPLLEEIKAKAQTEDWSSTAVEDLHVTIRKYSNVHVDLGMIDMRRYPLEFRCSHLEIRQPRELAINRSRTNNYPHPQAQWWTGVTEIHGRCSGCGLQIRSSSWEGFCPGCKQYETVTPIWSTEYYHGQ